MKINWEKVRDRRIQLNMTMEDMGRLLGVQRSAYNKYEKGQIKNISFDTFMKLTTALHVAPGYLMDIKGVGPYGPIEELETETLVMDSTPEVTKNSEHIDLNEFMEASIGDQVKMILDVWSKAKPATKRMILPVLEELTKLEKEEESK